jgi:hypothetical protein
MMQSNMEKISRQEAVKLGLSKYFTGEKCSRGHVAARRVKSSTCIECVAEYRARYYQENKEKEHARQNEWRRNNPEKVSSHDAKWYAANKDKKLADVAKRDAIELSASPKWDAELNEFCARQAYALAKLRGEITGFQWDVDHMIPLRARNVCGLHCWNNLQVIPAAINRSKQGKMIHTNPGEWIASA